MASNWIQYSLVHILFCWFSRRRYHLPDNNSWYFPPFKRQNILDNDFSIKYVKCNGDIKPKKMPRFNSGHYFQQCSSIIIFLISYSTFINFVKWIKHMLRVEANCRIISVQFLTLPFKAYKKIMPRFGVQNFDNFMNVGTYQLYQWE